MQQTTSDISKTEQAIFNLFHIVNELCSLKNELSIQDMDEIEKELEILASTLSRKRAFAKWVFPCIV